MVLMGLYLVLVQLHRTSGGVLAAFLGDTRGYAAAELGGIVGALFLAFGSLLSASSADQIVSFVTSTLVGFLFVLTGDERVVAILDGLSPTLRVGSFLYENVSALPPLGEFVRGVIELSSVLYFTLLSAVFLWTTGLVLERNRG